MRYAAQTTVSAEKSRADIEKLLARYGATGFFFGWQGEASVIGFTFASRMIRFTLEMPVVEDFLRDGKRKRTPSQAEAARDQAVRQRWRALGLVIKAKLEAVESKISTFENEFLANVVMSDGQTVGQWIAPQLAEMYETKNMPRLLPGLGGTSAIQRTPT